MKTIWFCFENGKNCEWINEWRKSWLECIEDWHIASMDEKMNEKGIDYILWIYSDYLMLRKFEKNKFWK